MLIKILKSQGLLAIVLLFSFAAEAGRRDGHSNYQGRNRGHRQERQYQERQKPSTPSYSYGEGTDVQDDADLIEAIRRGKTVQFLMAANMEVVQLLPDDNSGLRHQKWVVRLSNGQKVQAVYNSDMCPRVSIQVGDRVALAGMFLMTGQGPLMHWLHYDPSGKRPGGFVDVNGRRYCDK